MIACFEKKAYLRAHFKWMYDNIVSLKAQT